MYELPSFYYAEPSTVEEAVNILDINRPYAKPLAGGTELLNMMKDRVSGPTQPIPKILVNIKKIPELRSISINQDGWVVVGAATTLQELAEHTVVKTVLPILREASLSVATPQIRSIATVGGNLCQRPWCWYFRHPFFECFKKGGKLCYAVAGEHSHHFSIMNLGVCIAGHPSDLAPAFMAMDAVIEIAQKSGRRKIPLSELYLDGKNQKDTVLDSADLIVNVQVPPQNSCGMAFSKSRLRDTWDFSMANAAVVLETDNDVCVSARVAMGGLSPYPFRVRSVERLLKGTRLKDGEKLLHIVKQAFSDAKTLPMSREKKYIGMAVLYEALCRAAGQPVY
ncbi:MAG: FAD binding domain-containing protein [Candidatus Caldarchaeum sp.]